MSFLEPFPEMYGIWDGHFKRWVCIGDTVFCTPSLSVAFAQLLDMRREKPTRLLIKSFVVRDFNEWAEKSADEFKELIYDAT